MSLDYDHGDVLTASQRWTYIGSGVAHRNFLATVGSLTPSGKARLEEAPPVLT